MRLRRKRRSSGGRGRDLGASSGHGSSQHGYMVVNSRRRLRDLKVDAGEPGSCAALSLQGRRGRHCGVAAARGANQRPQRQRRKQRVVDAAAIRLGTAVSSACVSATRQRDSPRFASPGCRIARPTIGRAGMPVAFLAAAVPECEFAVRDRGRGRRSGEQGGPRRDGLWCGGHLMVSLPPSCDRAVTSSSRRVPRIWKLPSAHPVMDPPATGGPGSAPKSKPSSRSHTDPVGPGLPPEIRAAALLQCSIRASGCQSLPDRTGRNDMPPSTADSPVSMRSRRERTARSARGDSQRPTVHACIQRRIDVARNFTSTAW